MRGGNWESDVALLLLAAFLFAAVVLLAADRIDLAHAAHLVISA